MTRLAERVDWGRYVQDRWGVRNEAGGRGYELGVRILAACPLCGDRTGRAWANISKHRVACFRATCELHEGMWLPELARRVEGLRSARQAITYLARDFPAIGVLRAPAPPTSYGDWCRLPAAYRPFVLGKGQHRAQDAFAAFARRQWGLTVPTLMAVQAGFCLAGLYAMRLILPVNMGGHPVGFQARTIRSDDGAKYLTSKWGTADDPAAECGRPAGAMLYNIDSVFSGDEVILVEGIGDALRLMQGPALMPTEEERAGRIPTPVAVLGTVLTEEKAALLVAKHPQAVVVAFDADSAEASRQAARQLQPWLPEAAVMVGCWMGAKDAGAGARLRADPAAPMSVVMGVEWR